MARTPLAEKRAARRAAKAETPPPNPLAEPPAAAAEAAETRTPFVDIPHGKIRPDVDNARKEFDGSALQALADTIATHGLLQPLVVGPRTGCGDHILVAGERRWRAIGILIEAGQWPADKPVPCRLETSDERARMEAALIENLQRVDLNHMEAGLAFEALGSRFHLSNRVIAEKIGRSPEYVQQHRRLAQLEPEQQAAVREGRMPLQSALAILARPRAAELGPVAMMVLAEIYHACVFHPDKGAGQDYFGGCTECRYDAPEHPTLGGALQQLRDRGVISFTARHYSTRRAYMSIGYEGQAFVKGVLAPLKDKPPAALAALNGFRRAAGFDDVEADAPAPYYATFLCPPFDLHPEAVAAIAAEKARRAEMRAAETARKAALQARLAAIEALETRLAGDLGQCQDAELLGRLSAQVRYPLKATPDAIVDDRGLRVLRLYWGFGEATEAVARLFTLSLNLAAGFGKAEGVGPLADPDDGEAGCDDDADGDEDEDGARLEAELAASEFPTLSDLVEDLDADDPATPEEDGCPC